MRSTTSSPQAQGGRDRSAVALHRGYLCFFFSSRRRHTRYWRDWSSDVCSSDLGSQCRNPENWRVGIEKSRAVFDQMGKAGLNPRLLNIGGGFPVRHVKPIPAIEVIGEVVNRALEAFPTGVKVIAEPGRFLVSDAGYFVCRIMGTATRAGKRWMHLDAGLFGGIIETAEGLKYKIRTDPAGPDVPWNVAGPPCDSIDVVMRDEPRP